MRSARFGSVVRSTLCAYIRSIAELPAPRVLKDGRQARITLSNATLQQHLTVVRLFHDFLVEENICTRNPLRPAAGGRSLVQRHHQLPWIPSEEQWLGILQVCKRESLRNKVMLAMSYDGALHREEICSLETTDGAPSLWSRATSRSVLRSQRNACRLGLPREVGWHLRAARVMRAIRHQSQP